MPKHLAEGSNPDSGKPRIKPGASIKGIMIQVSPSTVASPAAASDIMTNRRRARATREHNKVHGDKIDTGGLSRFLVGKGGRLVKQESDKKKEAHIKQRMVNSRRKKPALNQK